MLGQVGNKVGIWIAHNKFPLGLAANKAVGEDDLTLRDLFAFRGTHNLSAVNLDAETTDEMLPQVTIKRRLYLFFGHRQNMV